MPLHGCCRLTGATSLVRDCRQGGLFHLADFPFLSHFIFDKSQTSSGGGWAAVSSGIFSQHQVVNSRWRTLAWQVPHFRSYVGGIHVGSRQHTIFMIRSPWWKLLSSGCPDSRHQKRSSQWENLMFIYRNVNLDVTSLEGVAYPGIWLHARRWEWKMVASQIPRQAHQLLTMLLTESTTKSQKAHLEI